MSTREQEARQIRSIIEPIRVDPTGALIEAFVDRPAERLEDIELGRQGPEVERDGHIEVGYLPPKKSKEQDVPGELEDSHLPYIPR